MDYQLWPTRQRTAQDFTKRLEIWFQEEHHLFRRLAQPLREILLRDAKAVYDALPTSEQALSGVEDAEAILQTLELLYGPGSKEPQVRRRKGDESQEELVMTAFRPWTIVINGHVRDVLERAKESDVVLSVQTPGKRKVLKTRDDRPVGKRRKIMSGSSPVSTPASRRPTDPKALQDIVVSSPERSHEPDERPRKKRRILSSSSG